MMKRLILAMAAALTLMGFGETNTAKRVAVFVQNKTNRADLQAEVPAIRERLVAALSEVSGFQVVDSTLASDVFEMSPKVAPLAGCDYAVIATIVGATAARRTISNKAATVFTLRMALKVIDANGQSVDGMPMWSRQLPIQEAADEPSTYYQMLIDQWAGEATQIVAQKALKWRAPTRANMVAFVVSTTIDNVMEKLESQTKGVNDEQLQELRKVVGGAAVELDGIMVGVAPCKLMASAGLHKLRVTRDWMKPYEATINVSAGQRLEIALELSEEGIAKWGTIESVRSAVAQGYSEAAWHRGIKVNVDTKNWQNVGIGTMPQTQINNVNQK